MSIPIFLFSHLIAKSSDFQKKGLKDGGIISTDVRDLIITKPVGFIRITMNSILLLNRRVK